MNPLIDFFNTLFFLTFSLQKKSIPMGVNKVLKINRYSAKLNDGGFKNEKCEKNCHSRI